MMRRSGSGLRRIKIAPDNSFKREFAQAQGLTYTVSYNDPQGLTKGLKARVEGMVPEKEFDPNFIMTPSSKTSSLRLL